MEVVEFFIDKKPLSERLGIDRRSLKFIQSEFDCKEEYRKDAESLFLGTAESLNQFGTGRLVLYRCHCGSDYCGVISCKLVIEDHSVRWENIGYEKDERFPVKTRGTKEDLGFILKEVPDLCFERTAYTTAVERK